MVDKTLSLFCMPEIRKIRQSLRRQSFIRQHTEIDFFSESTLSMVNIKQQN